MRRKGGFRKGEPPLLLSRRKPPLEVKLNRGLNHAMALLGVNGSEQGRIDFARD
jgi:hypothetical protein